VKAKRHSLLIALLEAGEIDSQQRAAELLQEHGIEATQATISRDFEELGVVRVHSGSSTRYAMSSQSSQFGAALPQVLRDYVIRAQTSGNIIVLHTPPGHASVVAAAIDRGAVEGILGVVAGDDTLFICADEKIGARRTLKRLERLSEE
jgi:transcriptional regulator of arginine metabolism